MKLDSSSDTDSSSGNTYSSSEENSNNVTFYLWQIVAKKLTKSKVLKEHIYIKKRLVSAYHEIKASLSENDVMLHVDFAESYRNGQQDALKSAYFGNQCFRIFTACCYARSPNNNDVRNENVIVVTESSGHDRVASMSCLQKVVHKIEHMHEKTYENVYVWSDGMELQFRSRYIFKLLASKSTMDGIGGKVKNVILRKVKPVNWWYILHLNFLRL